MIVNWKEQEEGGGRGGGEWTSYRWWVEAVVGEGSVCVCVWGGIKRTEGLYIRVAQPLSFQMTVGSRALSVVHVSAGTGHRSLSRTPSSAELFTTCCSM